MRERAVLPAGAQRAALASVVAAAFLVAIKLAAGLATGSLGLIAEAVHSGTDLVAALLTLFAVRVAVRPPDREHPFGHGKAEHLTALAEGAFLVAVSLGLAVISVRRLLGDGAAEVDAAWYALVVLGVVIVVDAARAVLSWRAARRYDSPALASNALHFASDLVGSAAVLAGLLSVRAGYPEGDSIAALAVAVLVIVAAARLMRENVQVLMDRSPGDAGERVTAAIAAAEPDLEIRRVRVRRAAGRHFADVVVAVKPDAAVGQGHAAADSVEDAVRTALRGDSDVVVHVEPAAGSGDLREAATAAALTVRGVREVHNVRITRVEGRLDLSLHLKLPADIALADAHAIATAVEAAITGAVPQVGSVFTHIEPLATTREGAAVETVPAERTVRRVVREHTGADPLALRIRAEAGGLVALLTVQLTGDQPLAEAHDRATAIERRIRAAVPDIVEVVVHTEPVG